MTVGDRPVTSRLGDREVGPGHPCYVIAEAGANHDRDLDAARRLIDVAAEAGADAVKFQTYSGRTLYSTKTPRFDYLGELGAKPAHELLDDVALPREWQPILAAHCRDAGIEFLSSPFDRAAVDELDALDVAAFKIASFELVDLPLIEYTASKGRPLILSTGMASLGEIEDAVAAARAAGAPGVCLLQCASLYPSPAAHHEPARDPDDGRRVRRARRPVGPHARPPRGGGRGRAGREPAREALHARPHDVPAPITRSRSSPTSSRSWSRTYATSRPRSATA